MTVRKGGAPVGGVMPPFGDKLSAEQIDAAIAFFQEQWSDRIYGAWLERNGEAAGSLRKPAPTELSDQFTARLKERLSASEISAPEPTPLRGLYQIKIDTGYAYVSGDGRYALLGDLVDLEQGSNLTDLRRNRDNLILLKAFQEQDMAVFPAAGEERARLTVFTDISCPYCRKLHREVPELQEAGVTLRYIPFPRAGTRGDAYRSLRAVWCADDRRGVIDRAMGGGVANWATASVPRPRRRMRANCSASRSASEGRRRSYSPMAASDPAIPLANGNLVWRARCSRPVAALRLLAIVRAMTRRRALPRDARNGHRRRISVGEGIHASLQPARQIGHRRWRGRSCGHYCNESLNPETALWRNENA